MQCSVCPNVARYPSEIRYCTDRLFRCHLCTETETRLDYERKQATSRGQRDQQVLHFPGGVVPDWYEG